MIPGECIPLEGTILLNQGLKTQDIVVSNSGDRPIQVGSHFHFAEVNKDLLFDREITLGFRLNIAAGTAVRFEPGDEKLVGLVALSGAGEVYGLNNKVNGTL